MKERVTGWTFTVSCWKPTDKRPLRLSPRENDWGQMIDNKYEGHWKRDGHKRPHWFSENIQSTKVGGSKVMMVHKEKWRTEPVSFLTHSLPSSGLWAAAHNNNQSINQSIHLYLRSAFPTVMCHNVLYMVQNRRKHPPTHPPILIHHTRRDTHTHAYITICLVVENCGGAERSQTSKIREHRH